MSVDVEARVYVEGAKEENGYGGSIHLSRVKGEPLIQITVHSGGWMGHGPVRISPKRLHDAIDELLGEDIGETR